MDPHYRTLDQSYYEFMGRGQFVLMRIPSTNAMGLPIFEMQAENTRVGSSATAVTRLTFGIPNTDDIFEVFCTLYSLIHNFSSGRLIERMECNYFTLEERETDLILKLPGPLQPEPILWFLKTVLFIGIPEE